MVYSLEVIQFLSPIAMQPLHIPNQSSETHLIRFVLICLFVLFIAYVIYKSFENNGITFVNVISLLAPVVLLWVARLHLKALNNYSSDNGITIDEKGLTFKGVMHTPFTFVPWDQIAGFTIHIKRIKYFKIPYLRLMLRNREFATSADTTSTDCDIFIKYIADTPENIVKKITDYHNQFIAKKPTK